jgi:hypothetical protein
MKAVLANGESSRDDRMIVTMTIADLRAFVRQELLAVSATNGKPEPLLFDTEAAAHFLTYRQRGWRPWRAREKSKA